MSYDDAAATYDRQHGDARSVRRFAIIERPLIEATRGATAVLEIGVGTGRLLSQVAAPSRVGVDVSAAMLRQAARRGDLALALADAHHLPFADACFDAVIAGKGVFRYLRLEEALDECARVLRPGGHLAFHQYAARTWSLRSLLGLEDDEGARALHVEDPAALARVVVAAGFHETSISLYRSIRFFPYALVIPRIIASRLWSHVVVVATRSNK